MQERSQAANILTQVIVIGRSLDMALPDTATKLTKALCYGSLRWYLQLEAIAKQLLQKPLKAKDTDIYCLIIIGLYQLKFLNVPQYAAINETVNACCDFKKPWAKKLVNAVLREFLRRNAFQFDCGAQYAHPNWLINALKKAWPNDWENILNQNNQHPPMCLRINQQKTSREDYLKKLAAINIPAKTSVAATSIIVEPVSIQKLPEFNAGLVSVQDAAAQFAAELLDLKPKLTVLDACAAPGGKTAHILETEPSCQVTALDQSNSRLKRVAKNLARIHAPAKLLCHDTNDVHAWWDNHLFDRILIDAPCSGTGVIRRHPDIKCLRRPNDIAQFAKQQRKLLNNLWPLLKPGGLLLYATCSILPEENEHQTKHFLQNHPNASVKPIKLPVGKAQNHGWQLLPSEQTDGFYYVCFKKAFSSNTEKTCYNGS